MHVPLSDARNIYQNQNPISTAKHSMITTLLVNSTLKVATDSFVLLLGLEKQKSGLGNPEVHDMMFGMHCTGKCRCVNTSELILATHMAGRADEPTSNNLSKTFEGQSAFVVFVHGFLDPLPT